MGMMDDWLWVVAFVIISAALGCWIGFMIGLDKTLVDSPEIEETLNNATAYAHIDGIVDGCAHACAWYDERRPRADYMLGKLREDCTDMCSRMGEDMTRKFEGE